MPLPRSRSCWPLLLGGLLACSAEPHRTSHDAAPAPPLPDQGLELGSAAADGARSPDATAADWSANRPDAWSMPDVWPPPDSAPAPVDATLDTALPKPFDPLCDAVPSGLGAYGYDTRATAMQIPFGYSMWISGLLGPGDPQDGKPAPRWFTFVVDAERSVRASFGGKDAYAAFYYEAETTDSFAVGYPMNTKQATLKAGRYYVKVADTFPRYFGPGPAWEVYVTWTVPPPACVADAGAP